MTKPIIRVSERIRMRDEARAAEAAENAERAKVSAVGTMNIPAFQASQAASIVDQKRHKIKLEEDFEEERALDLAQGNHPLIVAMSRKRGKRSAHTRVILPSSFSSEVVLSRRRQTQPTRRQSAVRNKRGLQEFAESEEFDANPVTENSSLDEDQMNQPKAATQTQAQVVLDRMWSNSHLNRWIKSVVSITGTRSFTIGTRSPTASAQSSNIESETNDEEEWGPLTVEAWIQMTTVTMTFTFANARKHYKTPLAAVIYWMPRVVPINSNSEHLPDGPLSLWWIAVKEKGSPFETAPVRQYLRTDQVAHWLYLSMQDLVGLLTLCTLPEAKQLNDYLCFRLDLMQEIQSMPVCFQWLNTGNTPQPGEYVYDILLKIRSLDDYRQKRLALMLHASFRKRRLASGPEILNQNANEVFSEVENRAMFDYLIKAWHLYRAKTSPVLDWNTRDLIPNFLDLRSPHRWYTVEDSPVDGLTIGKIQQVLDADMQFLIEMERDRNSYMLDEMAGDESWLCLHDFGAYFSHQLPYRQRGDYRRSFLPPDGPQPPDEHHQDQLRELVDWHRAHAGPEIVLVEQLYLTPQSSIYGLDAAPTVETSAQFTEQGAAKEGNAQKQVLPDQAQQIKPHRSTSSNTRMIFI